LILTIEVTQATIKCQNISNHSYKTSRLCRKYFPYKSLKQKFQTNRSQTFNHAFGGLR